MKSNSTTAHSGSSVAQGYPFKLSTDPAVALLTPGANESYVTLQVAPAALLLITGSEVVSLNGSAPNGIQLKISSSSATIGNFPAATVPLTLIVSNSTTPGNYSIQIQGHSGGVSDTGTFSVRVVQYLVYMENYTFVPQVMTVHPDSTVYWMNLDGPHLLCNTYDPGYHSVVFTTGVAVTTSSTTTSTTTTSAASPTLEQFDVWSYSFAQTGTYWYYSGLQSTKMNGTVIVSTG